MLFELSARAIATGTLELPVPTAQSILEATTIGWVRDDVRNQSYRQILYELSHRTLGREQFLRIDAPNALAQRLHVFIIISPAKLYAKACTVLRLRLIS